MIHSEVNVVLKDIWPMLLLFSIVLFTIRIVDVIINKKKFHLYKDLFFFSFILYLFLLFELVTSTDFESFSNNFIPFKEIMRYDLSSGLFYKNVIGNVLLFVPFGYFVSDIINNKKLILSMFITLVTSVSIEVIQMNIGRSFDIDDIILNFVGGIIGYGIYKFIDFIGDKVPSFLNKEWIYNILWIILVICATLFLLDYYNILEVL